jgi:hypothetical protein
VREREREEPESKPDSCESARKISVRGEEEGSLYVANPTRVSVRGEESLRSLCTRRGASVRGEETSLCTSRAISVRKQGGESLYEERSLSTRRGASLRGKEFLYEERVSVRGEESLYEERSLSTRRGVSLRGGEIAILSLPGDTLCREVRSLSPHQERGSEVCERGWKACVCVCVCVCVGNGFVCV